MKRRIDSVVSSMAIVLLFAAIWLITGCEQENSPVASEQELLMAPGNGNGNGDPHPEGDDEGDSNAGGKGKNKGRGNPHTSSNLTGDPHIDDVVPGVNNKPEKPGKNKEKSEKSKNDDPPEESIELTGTVASIEGNDIILNDIILDDIILDDGIVVHTCPKSHWFVDDDNNNGDNDVLEALIGLEITVFGKPVYDDDGVTLVAIYAYTIDDIIVSCKPPWAKGPKPKD